MKLLIYCVLVVILCFAGSHSYQIACDERELRSCIRLIMSMRLSADHLFAVPMDQLEKVCSQIDDGERCMHEVIEPCISDEAKECINVHGTKRCHQNQGLCTNWKLNACSIDDANQCINGTLIPCQQSLDQRCVSSFSTRNITTIDDPLQGTSFHMLQLIHEEKKGFCKYDGKLTYDFKKHQKCLARHNNILADCSYKPAAYPLNATSLMEFVHNNETLAREDCCEFYESLECVHKEYRRSCGLHAVRYVDTILKKASDRKTRCECARFKDSCSSSTTIALSSTLFIAALILIFGKQP